MSVSRFVHPKKVFLVAAGIVCSILFISGVFAFLTFDKQPVFAAVGDVELAGWAWSPTIGWISFKNASGPTYGVVRNGAFLRGYAWANPADTAPAVDIPNIGAIRFDPPGPYPSVPSSGTIAGPAQFGGSGNNLLGGWARACAVFVSACDGALRPDSERGGWDGWISLRGLAGGGYGVALVGTHFEGYAWGGDVVGPISFNPHCGDTTGNQTGPGTCGAGVMLATGYTMAINPSAQAITPGGTAAASIVLSSVGGFSGSVTISAVSVLPPGAQITFGAGGNSCVVPCTLSFTMGNFPAGSATYTITLRGSSSSLPDQDRTFSVFVANPDPRVDIKVNGSDGPVVVNPGQRVALRWTSTYSINLTPTGCRLFETVGTAAEQEIPGPFDVTTNTTHSFTATAASYRFRITCTYSGNTPPQLGTAGDLITINRRPGGFEEF